MLSLRHRASLGGLISAVVSIAVGAFALVSFIDTRVLERFDTALLERHTQLVVALNMATDDPRQLRSLVFDPAYDKFYSGRYWQVSAPNGAIYTSASLFDGTLPAPPVNNSDPVVWNTEGPEDEGVRGAFQQVTFEDGSTWGVSVAESLSELASERSETRESLLLAFALVGMIGLAGSTLVVTAILGPLRKLREDVAKRWDEDEELYPEDYPEEVAPLVEDINVLLHRNREIVASSRRQAADLAHALKTPTAIMRNELTALAAKGIATDMAQEALDRIDAQLGRSLARMRAANTAELSHSRTDLTNSINRFSRLFSSMAEREGKLLQTRNAPGLSVRMDTQDIEEVIGNLLDNALKWADSTVRLSTWRDSESIGLLIEDDGPGIPEPSVREALRSGGRLDTSKPGTGLGLAIATDLLKAYGAKLALERSEELGGLAARVTIPAHIDRRAA